MGKRLLIVWDGKTLHDDEVDEIVWSDGAGGVSVQGKVKRPGGGGGAGKGLLEMLTENRRQAMEKEIAERRSAAEVETQLPPEPEVIVQGPGTVCLREPKSFMGQKDSPSGFMTWLGRSGCRPAHTRGISAGTGLNLVTPQTLPV